MRRLLTTALTVLVLLTVATPAWVCGFEDPNGVAARRVVLNLVYPNALFVQGAVDTALRAGMIRREHLSALDDRLAFHRTAANLRRFVGDLTNGADHDLPPFSMVLMEPVLWAQVRPGSDGVAADIHASGPLANRVVVVTDVPVIAALVSGDISGADADSAGLVRFYGDHSEVDSLRKTLVSAFPGGIAQKSRGRDRRALPTFVPSSR